MTSTQPQFNKIKKVVFIDATKIKTQICENPKNLKGIVKKKKKTRKGLMDGSKRYGQESSGLLAEGRHTMSRDGSTVNHPRLYLFLVDESCLVVLVHFQRKYTQRRHEEAPPRVAFNKINLLNMPGKLIRFDSS